MTEIIQTSHKWTANIMIIIFLYSSIMWFWFSDDKKRIGNASFRIFITLEMLVSGLLLILGLCVLMSNPSWFERSGVYIKIILGFLAVGAIHICAAKTRAFVQSEMNPNSIKPINVMRVICIILLMTVYTTGTMIRALSDDSQINEVKTKIIDRDQSD